MNKTIVSLLNVNMNYLFLTPDRETPAGDFKNNHKQETVRLQRC